MKYFLSETGEVFAFEDDGSQDAFISSALVPLSDEELAAIREKQAQDQAPSHEDIAKLVGAKRDELLSVAALRIAPLQYAVDLDEATPAETSSLKQWKQYSLAVNRVTRQEGYPETVEWPEQPSQ